MLKYNRLLPLLLFLLGFLFSMAACDSGGDGDDDRVFSLPAGIEVQQIIGDSRGYGDRCFNMGEGAGAALFIYITLVNTTSSAIEVNMPAGLTFEPEPYPEQPQTVMITQDRTFLVETGAHSFCIWVNCVGGGAFPRDSFNYNFGPFVTRDCLYEIIDLLSGKNFVAMNSHEVSHIFALIQECAIMGMVLTEEDRDFFDSLP